MTLQPEHSPSLAAMDWLRHGFFGRKGGVSPAPYGSLNVGLAVGDDEASVSANRTAIAETLGDSALIILKQTHSTHVETITAPLSGMIEGDAMVTATPGLLLGIQTADCTPILFADPIARVVGAAHAGWRGAVDGIIGNTIASMVNLGADPKHIVAAYGPTIWAQNYEVGDQFQADFLALHPTGDDLFFTPTGGRAHFDLPGFVQARLRDAGVSRVEQVGGCTYANPDLYFSHRLATHQSGKTGRQLSAIGITPR
jgi:YfiH family protein